MQKLIEKIFVVPTTNLWLQLIRYGFVGGVAFLADYGALYLLTDACHLHYLWSAAMAFVIGLTVNYLLSISWVFCKERVTRPWVEFLVFAGIGVVGMGLNEGIIYVCTDMLTIHYMVSKLVSTAIVFFWNFFARKLILFHKKD